MTIYTITPDSIITAHATEADAKSITQAEQFSSAKELAKAAAQWPSSHLVEIWNSLPGQKPVKKFSDRKAAVGRIWNAIQNLVPDTAASAARVAPNNMKPDFSEAYESRKSRVPGCVPARQRNHHGPTP